MSFLPLKVMCLVSDLLFPVIYYLARYRRKVVRKNLTNAFPEKTASDIIKIEKRFYRYLGDLIFETFKQLNAGESEMIKRIKFENIDFLRKHAEEGRSVMLMSAHYCNWEWSSVISAYFKEHYKVYPIYQKLSNKHFDELMYRLRSRFGAVNIEKDSLFKIMHQMKSDNIAGIFGMISDQSPMEKNIRYRMDFLNQDTAVFLGTEQLAKRFDYPVYYLNVKRIKRGYYQAVIEPICLNPAKSAEYEITTLFMQKLEKIIQAQPEYWLWTHNRWKHARKDT